MNSENQTDNSTNYPLLNGLVEAEFAGIAGQPNLVFFYLEHDLTVAINVQPMLALLPHMPQSLNYCALCYSGKQHPKELLAEFVAKTTQEFGLGMIAIPNHTQGSKVPLHIAVEDSEKLDKTGTYRTHVVIGVQCEPEQYQANLDLLERMVEAAKKLNPETLSTTVH